MRVFEEPAYGENLPRGYTPPQHVAAGPRAGTAQPSAPIFALPGQAGAEQLVRALDGALDGVTSALDEKLGFVTGGGAKAPPPPRRRERGRRGRGTRPPVRGLRRRAPQRRAAWSRRAGQQGARGPRWAPWWLPRGA